MNETPQKKQHSQKRISDEAMIAIIALHERGYTNAEIARKLVDLGVTVTPERVRQKIKQFYNREISGNTKRRLPRLRLPKPDDVTPEAYLKWIRERFMQISLDAQLSTKDNKQTIEMQALAQARTTIEVEKKFNERSEDDDMKDLLKALSGANKTANKLDKATGRSEDLILN